MTGLPWLGLAKMGLPRRSLAKTGCCSHLFAPKGLRNKAQGNTLGPRHEKAPALDPRPALSKHGCSLELGNWNLALDPRLFLELRPLSFALPGFLGSAIDPLGPGIPNRPGGRPNRTGGRSNRPEGRPNRTGGRPNPPGVSPNLTKGSPNAAGASPNAPGDRPNRPGEPADGPVKRVKSLSLELVIPPLPALGIIHPREKVLRFTIRKYHEERIRQSPEHAPRRRRPAG